MPLKERGMGDEVSSGSGDMNEADTMAYSRGFPIQTAFAL